MSIVNVRFHSEALAKRTNFNVIYPDRGEGPFPVLFQLHGFSDDNYSWLYNSNLVRHVVDLPLIVVLPDGGTSRYLNVRTHERYARQNYEDLIMRDIPAEVNRLFHVRPGPWAIGGLSMGGYGALRLGMKYPDRFDSIWAHSAGLRPLDEDFLALLDQPNEADVHHFASLLKERGSWPVISFDCGTEDFLIEHNRDLNRYLDEIGLPHTYQEHPGAHTWGYWDEPVQEALAQHARVLGIATETG